MTRTATNLPYTEMPVAEGNYGTNRVQVDRIVIHTMVASAASAASRFNTYGQQVSAHYGVKLDGSLIHWLEENLVAYHAGSMSMNQRSIGIEHEDNGDYNGTRPDSLYTESAKLVKDICNFYNIPIDRQHIIKHSEVIATGCPDALDIDRIVREASGQSGTMYKGYDLTNQDSMKIAVDILVRLQSGDLVNKIDLDTANAKVDSFKQMVDSQHNAIVDFQSKIAGLNATVTSLNAQIATLKDQLAHMPLPSNLAQAIRPLVWAGWVVYLQSRSKIQQLVGN